MALLALCRRRAGLPPTGHSSRCRGIMRFSARKPCSGDIDTRMTAKVPARRAARAIGDAYTLRDGAMIGAACSVRAARHQHRHRRCDARIAAGGRRLRRPAARGYSLVSRCCGTPPVAAPGRRARGASSRMPTLAPYLSGRGRELSYVANGRANSRPAQRPHRWRAFRQLLLSRPPA